MALVAERPHNKHGSSVFVRDALKVNIISVCEKDNIYIFIRTYFLLSSTQKIQLYTNKIYKKIIIIIKYMNKMNGDMSEN